MFNFLFHSSKTPRRITALEIANERLRTLEIELDKETVARANGEVIGGLEQAALPFSVERIAKAVWQSVERGEFVVAVHPELSPLCLVSVQIALQGKQRRVDEREEQVLTARVLNEAGAGASAMEVSRTGLHETDLVVVYADIQERQIDGYAVDRLSGFSGDTLSCKVACCVVSRSLFRTLCTLQRALKERDIPVRAGFEEVVFLEHARRANKSGIVVFLGYAVTHLAVFREGKIRESIPILWGVRELFAPFDETFGMKEHTARELLLRYEKGTISEALRKKTRELVLSHLSQFATLVTEAIANTPSHSHLPVELIGECAGLSELQECLKVRKTHVLLPKNARMPKSARISSDSAFTLLSMSALNARHKILDLTPKKEAAPSLASAQSSDTQQERDRSLGGRVVKILSVGLIAGLLTGAMLWHFVFATASVTLIPQTRSVSANILFAADSHHATVNVEDRAIPALVLTEKKEAVRVFPATGKREKETYAEGAIRVFNTQAAKSQILVANTRFIAANGKLFKTTARVTVPPGFIDVRVKAAEAGETYNIEPTTFSLPGLAGTSLYTAVYGKSSQPMTGGAKTAVTVVTESDIASAQLALKDNLAKQAKEALGNSVGEGYVWLPDFTATSVMESKPLVKAGSELEQFNISSSVRVAALVFRQQDAEALLKDVLSRLLSQEERLEESSVKVYLKGERFRENADAGDIAGTVEGTGVRAIDEEAVKAQLVGVSKKAATALLKAYAPLKDFQIKVAPFWRQSLPANTSRVTLSVRVP